MPISLQMEASALDCRRDIVIELDSLVSAVRSFYRQSNIMYPVYPTTTCNVWARSKGHGTHDFYSRKCNLL